MMSPSVPSLVRLLEIKNNLFDKEISVKFYGTKVSNCYCTKVSNLATN